ncbi:RasGTPase-activating protein [Pelomyxa schiedti]|nr:RasGTPase-activating protein [Pelomyxa schiedti]
MGQFDGNTGSTTTISITCDEDIREDRDAHSPISNVSVIPPAPPPPPPPVVSATDTSTGNSWSNGRGRKDTLMSVNEDPLVSMLSQSSSAGSLLAASSLKAASTQSTGSSPIPSPAHFATAIHHVHPSSIGARIARPLLGRRPVQTIPAQTTAATPTQSSPTTTHSPAHSPTPPSKEIAPTSSTSSTKTESGSGGGRPRGFDWRSTTMKNLMDAVNTFKSALLTVHLTGGTNLKTNGGKPKPNTFCEIYLVDSLAGGNTTTSTTPASPAVKRLRAKLVEGDSNPVWDEEFSIEVPPSTRALRIDVMSCGKLSKDKLLGFVDVPVSDFSHWQSNGIAPISVEKGSKATGEISFSLSFTTAMDRNKYLKISKDFFDQLQSILTNPELYITMAICRALWSSSEDAFSLALIRIFHQKSMARNLVVQLLTREVTIASDKTFLRQNTLATRLAMHYFKLIGFQYLNTVLKPHIDSLLADSTIGVELRDGDGFSANVRLAVISQAILENLFRNVNLIPLNIRLVLWELKQVLVKQGRPQLASTLAIAVFFLRYFCPAVFFPEQFYLSSVDISPENRRALTMIAKVIQSLANASRQEDSLETSHMEIIAQLIEPLREPMDNFIVLITEKPDSAPPDETHSQLREDDYPKLMAIVVRKLAESFTTIETSLKAGDDTSAEDYLALAEFEVLKSIITS